VGYFPNSLSTSLVTDFRLVVSIVAHNSLSYIPSILATLRMV